jgi:hypothetical protein
LLRDHKQALLVYENQSPEINTTCHKQFETG